MAESVDTNRPTVGDTNEIREPCGALVREPSSAVCNGVGGKKQRDRNKKYKMELFFNEKNSKVEVNPLFDEAERLIMPAEEKPVLHVQFNHKDSDASIKKVL